jgi:pyrroline-5-carboxylate reductase
LNHKEKKMSSRTVTDEAQELSDKLSSVAAEHVRKMEESTKDAAIKAGLPEDAAEKLVHSFLLKVAMMATKRVMGA